MRMVGRHNGMALGIGDAVNVLVVEVTPVNGGILLSYVDGGGTSKRRYGTRAGRGGRPRAASKATSKTNRAARAKATAKGKRRKTSGKARRSR